MSELGTRVAFHAPMSNSITRGAFCRLSLSGLIGLASCRKQTESAEGHRPHGILSTDASPRAERRASVSVGRAPARVIGYAQAQARLVLPVLIERGIGVLGMKALGSGDILKSSVVQAEECLRYALSLPTSVVITGIDSKEILAQALRG